MMKIMDNCFIQFSCYKEEIKYADLLKFEAPPKIGRYVKIRYYIKKMKFRNF